MNLPLQKRSKVGIVQNYQEEIWCWRTMCKDWACEPKSLSDLALAEMHGWTRASSAN